MVPMKGVYGRRQTRQLAELTSHNIVAADVVRHVAEFGARVAREALPVENHVASFGFELFNPTWVDRRAQHAWRRGHLTREGNGNPICARVSQSCAAIRDHFGRDR